MGGIHFDITGDNKNFLRKLQEVSNGVKSTANEVEQEGMKITDIFDKMKKVIGTTIAGVAIKDLVSQIAMVRSEFQKLEVSFNTMLGDSGKANQLMQQLTKTAAITPFGLQDVAGGAKQLLAYGLSAEKVNETLIRLGDISAGLSIPLGDLVYLYGTTMTQGQLFTQDFRQFMGRGIPLAEELAKQFGVTKDEVGALVTAGKIGFEQVQKAIESMTNAGGKFGGLMEAQSKTIGGQISNIEDAIDMMFNEIGQAQEGVINGTLGAVSVLIENYETIGKVIAGLVATIGVYNTALVLNAVLIKDVAIAESGALFAKKAVTLATKAQTIAQTALNKAMSVNPYIAIASVLITLVPLIFDYLGGIKLLVGNSKELEKTKESLANASKKEISAIEEEKKTCEQLIAVVENETATEEERQKALKKLQVLMPDVFGMYQNERQLIDDIKNAKKNLNAETEKEIKLAKDNQLQKYKSAYEDLTPLANLLSKERKEGLSKQEKIRVKELKSILSKAGYFKSDASVEDIAGVYSAYKEFYAEALKNQKEQTIANYSVELNKLTKSQLQSRLEALEKMVGTQAYDINSGEEISQTELKIQIKEIQKRLKNFTSYSDELAKAKKDMDDAKKHLDSLNKKDVSSKTYKDAKTDYEAKKKKYDEMADTKKSAKEKSEASKLKKEQAEYEKIVNENQQEALKQARDNAIEKRQLEIDLMKDGTEKKLAQLNLDYTKEYNEIQNWEEELRKAKVEAKRKEFEANPANKNKAFDASSVDTSLTQDEETLKNQKTINWVLDYWKQVADVKNEQTQKDKEAYAEYVKEYGTYLEKKALLLQQHQEKIKKIQEEGGGLNAINLENAQYQSALNQLEIDYGNTTNKISLLFADTRNKSVKELREISEEARKALNWILESKEYDENNEFGISKEQYNKIKNSPTEQKNISDTIDQVEDKANNLDTVFGQLQNGITKAFNAKNIEDFNDALSLVSSGVGAITGALDMVAGALSNLGAEGVANAIGEVANVMNSTMQGAQAGAAFGPLGAVAGAAIGLVSSLSESLIKLHDAKHEKAIIAIQENIDELTEEYEKLSIEIEKAYSHDARQMIEEQNVLLKQQQELIRQQKVEEEAKKNTDKDKLKEYDEKLESIGNTIEENKEKAIDAIFGEDLQSAIENFASAYADSIASGDGAWKSSKDYAKNMMKQMVMESIKSAISSSKAIENIRAKLEEFYKDGVLSATEQAWVYEATEKAMKEIESQFGWADDILSDSATQQEATRKGISSLTQEQGDALEGRFTSLQLSGESIKESMLSMLGRVDSIYSITTDTNEQLREIRNLVFLSTGYLEDIAKHSKPIGDIGAKLDKIIENTKGLV